MLKKYPEKVNLVIKHFPLSRHKFARKASRAALAAERQGKYGNMTKILLAEHKSLNDMTIKKHAAETGLDMEKFDKDTKDPSLDKIISGDLSLGRKIKVNSVPYIFINGKPAKARTLNALSQMIEKELKTGQ